MISGVISFALSITMLVLAIKHHRDNELGGYISFGRGFKTGFLTALFYGIIATIWTVIFINFIATDMIEVMQAAMYEEWESQGLTEEQIEQVEGLCDDVCYKRVYDSGIFWGRFDYGFYFFFDHQCNYEKRSSTNCVIKWIEKSA